MKRVSGILFFLVLLVFILEFIAGNSGFDKVDSKVISILSEEDSVRVFVEFEEEGDDFLDEESRQNVIRKIGEENVIHSFEDEISVVVNKNDILELELDSSVKSVELVGVRKIFLQDSVPLVNASSSFSLKSNGLNLTGAGQTICVIDTGVDYTHPSLGDVLGKVAKSWGGGIL